MAMSHDAVKVVALLFLRVMFMSKSIITIPAEFPEPIQRHWSIYLLASHALSDLTQPVRVERVQRYVFEISRTSTTAKTRACKTNLRLGRRKAPTRASYCLRGVRLLDVPK